MKPMLLAVAVILTLAVYEMDRGARLATEWQTQLEVERLLDEDAGERGRMAIDGESGSERARPMPHRGIGSHAATGRVEREQSTRLFGPGVSRRQQIRV
ncbi:MAG: hypothetical protein ACM3SS_04190 [Rhodospirillaceae bacterium]